MTGEQMREARLRLGLTQQQLALALGYSGDHVRQRISEFERPRCRVAIPKHIAMLVQAIEQGYRPENWPQQEKEHDRT
jgi:transcriptional regulator with XRE-family HTH domain